MVVLALVKGMVVLMLHESEKDQKRSELRQGKWAVVPIKVEETALLTSHESEKDQKRSELRKEEVGGCPDRGGGDGCLDAGLRMREAELATEVGFATKEAVGDCLTSGEVGDCPGAGESEVLLRASGVRGSSQRPMFSEISVAASRSVGLEGES